MTAQTLLIGLDGATFSILDPLMAEGVMPFLRDFVQAGVRAPLMSVAPPLTPPAWTSLATGRSPGHHGIFDFFVQEAPGSRYFRFVNYHDIHAETIWSVANRHGLRAATLNFPFMFPPPALDGVVVSGFIPWRQLRLGTHPASFYDRLRLLPGFNPRELAMDMDLEAKAIEGCDVNEYEGWIALHLRRERNWLQAARLVYQEEPSALTALVFDGVDKVQHLCWRYLDKRYLGNSPSAQEQEIRELCLAYFRTLDKILAELVQLAGPEATVVLASDHGFGAQTHTFFINTWLEQHGYLAWAAEQSAPKSATEELGVSELARHIYRLDWQRTRAYAPSPGGNGIYIVRASDETPNGVPAVEVERFRRTLAQQLLAFRDPDTGEPVVEQVYLREEIFAGPHEELAPDLTLRLRDSGFVSIVASDQPLRRRATPTGTHRPEGIFIAKGPGIRQGEALPALSILDVAPLLLYTLDTPIPEEMEGRVPLEAFEQATASARPVRRESGSQRPVSPAPAAPVGPALDQAGEQELMRRLRALGYVE